MNMRRKSNIMIKIFKVKLDLSIVSVFLLVDVILLEKLNI